jgi:hypothetical protein
LSISLSIRAENSAAVEGAGSMPMVRICWITSGH